MSCIFCHSERESPALLICSGCVQILCRLSPEQVQKAHGIAKGKGYVEKASWLSQILEEKGEEYVPKTSRTKRSLDRGRTVREARSSHYRKRAVASIDQLDKGRVAAY